MFFIIEGSVKIISPDGKKVLTVLEKGAYVG